MLNGNTLYKSNCQRTDRINYFINKACLAQNAFMRTLDVSVSLV